MYRYLTLTLLTIVSLNRCEKPETIGMSEVTGFGSNPGELKCYQYVPEGLRRNAPLVVVLHGCLQDAVEMARLSGWNTLADQEKFVVLYPQQQGANNINRCFNWFNENDYRRGSGETLSIKQMIDHTIAGHGLNRRQVFITGISAGGAMAAVMLATYPEVFESGTVMAGVPYGAATDIPTGMAAMSGAVVLSPQDWGDKVRAQNPGYAGTWPRLAIVHGVDDPVVKIANAGELVKQWSNLWGLAPSPGQVEAPFQGNDKVTRTTWSVQNKRTIVRYDIQGLGHAIAVDPGAGPRQGGQTATFAKDVDFHSTWWAAEFFGIVR